jgi:hypothetical protein
MMQMQMERAKHKTTADGKKKRGGKKLTVAKAK